MPDVAERARVVAAARSWIDTPFHDLARVKGVGVDCAQLVAAVMHEAGIVETPIDTGYYAPQFMLHDKAERLANFVLRYAREIEDGEIGHGDIVLYKVGHSFSHAAIVVDWPRAIIHAHKLSGKVIEMRPFDADMSGRKVRLFSPWGV